MEDKPTRIVLVTRNEQIHTLIDPDAAAFLAQLDQAAQADTRIHYLCIQSRADENTMQLRHDVGYTLTLLLANGQLILQEQIVAAGRQPVSSEIPITSLLEQILTPDAIIVLNGCRTGKGGDNLARNLSLLLPGRTVCGCAGGVMARAPLFRQAVRRRKFYRNAQLVLDRTLFGRISHRHPEINRHAARSSGE